MALHVKSWRTRMGLTRKEAADLLGISVFAIKSYELKTRELPKPTEMLMLIKEKEKMGHTPQDTRIVVVGGGTIENIDGQVAVCAPCFGETAQSIMSVLEAYDEKPQLTLTKIADPKSIYQNSEDLKKLAKSIIQNPAIKVIFWTPSIVEYHVQSPNLSSSNLSPMISHKSISPEYTAKEYTMTKKEKIISWFKKERSDVLIAGYKTVQDLDIDQQIQSAHDLLISSRLHSVLLHDAVRHEYMIIGRDDHIIHQGKDKEVAIAALVEDILSALHQIDHNNQPATDDKTLDVQASIPVLKHKSHHTSVAEQQKISQSQS